MHIGKITMKNLEVRDEQEKFSVLKNEFMEIEEKRNQADN